MVHGMLCTFFLVHIKHAIKSAKVFVMLTCFSEIIRFDKIVYRLLKSVANYV